MKTVEKTVQLVNVNGTVENYTYKFNSLEVSKRNYNSLVELYDTGKTITPVKNEVTDDTTGKTFPLYNIGSEFVFRCDVNKAILQSPNYIATVEPMYSNVRYNNEYKVLVSLSEDKQNIHVVRCSHITSSIPRLELLEEHYILTK